MEVDDIMAMTASDIMVEQLKSLRARLTESEKLNAKLESEVAFLKKDNDDLMKDNDDLRRDNDDLEKRNAYLEKNYARVLEELDYYLKHKNKNVNALKSGRKPKFTSEQVEHIKEELYSGMSIAALCEKYNTNRVTLNKFGIRKKRCK